MNALLMRSKAAVARLRAFKPPPFPLWDRLPASRRAAVLLLLYADKHGDLRVVITMRAANLRHFSGEHADGSAGNVKQC
jgi:coenzyme A diphosphatase NUDT7